MINVKSLCGSIKKIISKSGRAPAKEIPAVTMLCSLAKRPGLSTIVSLANVIQAFKKHGIETGPMPDGSPNKYVLSAYCILDEVFRAVREDANIQGAGAPGAFSIITNGANAGGPVTSNGSNINPFKIVGLMQ